ncbi:MAG TPA: DUF5335 family protein [Rhizomicrobium sp.]|jgi:hypothetical protein|nr:DUF5335 family protein [Rhizomicrobium sp.]
MSRKVEKAEWSGFLDRVSRELAGKRIEVEVDAPDLGAQIEAEWVPLIGLTYDNKDDMIEIALEGLDHIIHNPRELHVEETVGRIQSLLISNGTRQILTFREPLLLPPPLATDTSGNN